MTAEPEGKAEFLNHSQPPAASAVISSSEPVRFSASRRRPVKELKIPMTYKHRESHYKRLKRISQALEVSMGELIDEALEAKFSEWEAELQQHQ